MNTSGPLALGIRDPTEDYEATENKLINQYK